MRVIYNIHHAFVSQYHFFIPENLSPISSKSLLCLSRTTKLGHFFVLLLQLCVHQTIHYIYIELSWYCIIHSLIIIREVLILTLSTPVQLRMYFLIHPKGWINDEWMPRVGMYWVVQCNCTSPPTSRFPQPWRFSLGFALVKSLQKWLLPQNYWH